MLPAYGLFVVFGEVDGVDGRFVAENYPTYGIASGLVVIVLAFICVMGTRFHTSRPEHGGEQYGLPSPKEFLTDVTRTFRNKTFRSIILYDIASSMSWGCVSTLNILVATYVFELSTDETAYMLAGPSLVAVGVVLLILKPLGKYMQKPQMLRMALWLMLLNSLWLMPLKILDLLPENDSPVILWLNLIYMGLFMFFFLIRIVCTMSIVADITDQAEVEHGNRGEGGFFSVVTFTSKISSLFGPLYGGIALDIIGLDQQQLPGEVAAPVLNGLMYAILLGGIPLLALALAFAYRIRFSKEQFDDIQTTLRERRAVTD